MAGKAVFVYHNRSKFPMIAFSKPVLPDLDKLCHLLQESWTSGIVTNNGPLLKRLEERLCQNLKLSGVSVCSNGTSALVNAIKASTKKHGEIITTPFTFAATTNSIVETGHKIVFADIDPNTLNLCPHRVREQITRNTVAIIPVHTYGNICDVVEFQKIQDSYNIPVIYDASHCFGITDEGGSILRHGFCSTLSFHCTKAFNSIEGGAIVSEDCQFLEKVKLLRNFGIQDSGQIKVSGLNAKMSELHAAVGLLNLDKFEENKLKRKNIFDLYKELLSGSGISIKVNDTTISHNYSYMPIEKPGISASNIQTKLLKYGVYAKRYFYPLTSQSKYLNSNNSLRPNLTVANKISKRIICLPIYDKMSPEDVEQVASALIT
jgi:dTDP-4-amino-4,6-dideoxygalactose transaminase